MAEITADNQVNFKKSVRTMFESDYANAMHVNLTALSGLQAADEDTEEFPNPKRW